MTDRELDALIRAAAPAPPAGDLDAAGDALRRAIPAHDPVPRRARVPLGRRSLAVGLAAACALGAAAWVGVERVGDGSGTAWAAPLVRAAESSPRVLVAEDGWTIERVSEWTVGAGEIQQRRGGEDVQINWYLVPDGAARATPRGAEPGLSAVGPVDVLGRPVPVLRYDGSDRYLVQWREGRFDMTLDVTASGPDRLRAIAGSLRATGVDAWLSAMPADAVRPDARPVMVAEMLRDVPLPEGFDTGALAAAGGRVTSRYDLGAEVAGAVSCEWIGRWVAARRSGDAPAAAAALAAMATSREWPVLREMQATGHYPEVLWDLADRMASGEPVPAGTKMDVATAYRSSLGCDAR